jgi:hypothetical protein
MALQQNRRITARIDGREAGVFDTIEGGDVNGVVTKRRSGGMGPIKQSSGLPDYADVTITRESTHAEVRRYMLRAGKAEMSVSDFELDVNGQSFDRPITYVGKLMTVAPPPANSESSDYAMLSLTMSVRSVA